MIPKDRSDRLDRLVARAVEMSADHVAAGGIPFTGLVVDRHGTVLGSGVNRVLEDRDPTAHAEVVAIRDACRAHGNAAVRGATLIASGEPCALCYLSALFAGIGEVVFAADRHVAARAGFDYRGSYSLFAADPTDWPLEVRYHATEDARRPFELWLRRRGG